jgi:hypothetical protein
VSRSESARLLFIAIVVFGLIALGSCSAWFISTYFGIEAHAFAERLWPSLTADQVEARQLRKIAGWFSLDCGHVRHREDADRAISCAQGALRTGRRFYVAFDYIGLDSHGTTGLAANSKGTVYQVDTDELGRGWGGSVATHGVVRTVTVTRCEQAPIERTYYPANRDLTCLTTSKIE